MRTFCTYLVGLVVALIVLDWLSVIDILAGTR